VATTTTRPGTWIAGALAAAALAACDDGKNSTDPPLPPPPSLTGRANVVAPREAASATTPAPTAPARPAAPRQLCAGQSSRAAPKGSVLRTATATDAAPPPANLPLGVGKWVWINLWAAWCGPCKEEMPRLVAWQEKLRASGVLIDLAFVSMDDDERQTRRFLDAQPAGGVRATYWLPEAERAGWLGALGIKGAGELPVHALVAPGGQVACVLQGAVEDADYPALAAFIRAAK
jgi:thiol-disulfide isomerase/thioredoxin